MDDQLTVRLDPRLARRLADKKAQLDRYRPLSPAIVRRLHDDLRVLLTYHSNAIEGNTLSLRETQMVIEHGVTAGGHSLREYLEATSHATAFARLTELADDHMPITIETILDLHRLTMGQLEWLVIQQVGFKYRGAGRMVYPGLAQLTSFIAMNASTHNKAFIDKVFAEARGDGTPDDKHNRFYDEYLAIMDMTAEFYLSTVERVFKGREIARNAFTVDGKPVDFGRIRDTWVMAVEGAEDDISAPGQCVAALDLCTGIPETRKARHLEPEAGHYGIFAGKSWRLNIRPAVLDFIDAAAGVRRVRKRGGAAPLATSFDAPVSTGRVAV